MFSAFESDDNKEFFNKIYDDEDLQNSHNKDNF